MSRMQQYLANAQDCARRGAMAGDAAARLNLERAEAAWRVLAGIEAEAAEPAPQFAPAKANRQGYRAGWYTG